LDLADIPYVGSGVLGSAIGIDKIMTKAVLKENGLPVLDYLWFTRADWEQDSQKVIDRVLERFSFPVIVKPSRLGSTIGIQKATSAEELTFAIDAAIHYDHRALVEPYIRNRTEINCAVLGNSDPIPSACEQPVSRDALLSYQDKYLHNQSDRGMEGATRIIPAPISVDLTKRIQDLAVDAFRAIGGLGIARVDFLMDVDSTRVYVNELNTMPGSIAYYLWEPTGIKPQQLVDRLLDLAVEAYRDKRKNTYTFATPLLQQSDLLKLRKG
jgi:D-alanine-D-alanine ligase